MVNNTTNTQSNLNSTLPLSTSNSTKKTFSTKVKQLQSDQSHQDTPQQSSQAHLQSLSSLGTKLTSVSSLLKNLMPRDSDTLKNAVNCLMGFESTTSTDRYFHENPQVPEDVAARFNEAIQSRQLELTGKVPKKVDSDDVKHEKPLRVRFFHWDDGFKPSAKNGQKTSSSSSSEKKDSTHPRRNGARRVLSYVWCEKSGFVFYAGSVYNPLRVARDEFGNPVKPVASYNKQSETSTAFGRLCKRPIIFQTACKTDREVRNEIVKMMFVVGNKLNTRNKWTNGAESATATAKSQLQEFQEVPSDTNVA